MRVLIILSDSRGKGVAEKINKFLKEKTDEEVHIENINIRGAGYNKLLSKLNKHTQQLKKRFAAASFIAVLLSGLCSFTTK